MVIFESADPNHLLLLCAAAAVAGFVRGFSGFGGPATISLLLAHAFFPATLLPKIVLLDFYAYPLLLWNTRRSALWAVSLPMAAVTILLLPLGLQTMQTLDPQWLKRLIAIACLLGTLVAMTGFQFTRMPSLAANLVAAVVLGGILATTFIALPIVAYFLLMPMNAATCRATIISFSVTVMPFLVAILFFKGVLQTLEILPVAAAGVTYFVMIWIGTQVFQRATERNYRRGAQWFVALLAISVLL